MNMEMQTKVKTTSKPSFTPVRSGLLQRKCACGGNPGMDGECGECRAKHLSMQHRSADQTNISQIIQTKLTVNEPRDEYEQEAERVAEQVMRMSEPSVSHKEAQRRNEATPDAAKHVNIQGQTQNSLVQTRISSQVVKRIEQYDEIIDRIATEEGIHPNWVRGVIATESGGQATQSAGSGYTGLMQAERGKEQTDPETSIRAGVKKLKSFQTSLGKFLKQYNINLSSFNNETAISLVMVAYNAGPGTVKKAMLYAIASGNIEHWMEPENFQRALIYYGAYSIKDALPSMLRGLEGGALATELAQLTGMNEVAIRAQYSTAGVWNKRGLQLALIQHVDSERKQLRYQNLTLEQVRSRASRWLLQSVAFKHNNLKDWYVGRVLEYMRYYDQMRPVEYIKFEENEEALQSAEKSGTEVVGEQSTLSGESSTKEMRQGESLPSQGLQRNAEPSGTILQRAPFNSASSSDLPAPSIVHGVLRSSGQPLDRTTRTFMETRFGHDFSQVRVHTDERAVESARCINALAYTVGQDVVFGVGQYAPKTTIGKRLLAHELTHTMQQNQHPRSTANRASMDNASHADGQHNASVTHLQNTFGFPRLQRQTESRTPQGTSSQSPMPKTIIVIGSPDPHQTYQLQFATAAECQSHDNNTIWLVERTGYELYGIPPDYFERFHPAGGFGWITPNHDLVGWLNSMLDHSIGKLIVYSHGRPGLVMLRYGWGGVGAPDYGLSISEVVHLNKNKFTDDADIEFNSCNTGTQTDTGNLAQSFANQVGRPVRAWTGRTSYSGINKGTCSVGPSTISSVREFFTEGISRLRGRTPRLENFQPEKGPNP